MYEKYHQSTTLLQTYCREFSNWSRYMGIPKYDIQLAHCLSKTATKMHIHIDLSLLDTEIYVPLIYDSVVGEHQFHFPAFKRNTHSKVISELSHEGLCELIAVASTQENEQHHFSIDLNTDKDASIENLPLQVVHPRTIPITLMLDIPATGTELPWAVFYLQKYLSNNPKDSKEAVQRWLLQYLRVINYHQLGCSIRLDETGFPVEAYGKTTATDSDAILEWIQSVLIHHIFKLIGLIGRHGLLDEHQSVAITYDFFEQRSKFEKDALAQFIINQRHFKINGYLSNGLRTTPNILHETYWDSCLLQPKLLKPVYSKTFPKKQITVTIRPFNIDSDLEMVHRWFHLNHAKDIWQMNWDLTKLEQFYRGLLADKWGHAYIGEINGVPTFNVEVYWATRDIVGNYFDVLPTDYGTHLFIAPTNKHKKFPSETMQSIVSWLFERPKVGRLVGEGAVESMAALMNKIHVGFKLQRIIKMPHKKAHLNLCYREWYWEKFPQNKPVEVEQELYL